MKGVTGRHCLLAFVLIVLTLPHIARAQVVISEVMYNPKGTDTGREWIELFNPSSADVTLVGGSGKGAWKINDSSNHTLTDPAGGTGRGSLVVPAGGYLVVTSDPTTFMSEYPGGSYSVIKSSLSLNNSGTAISLLDGTGAAIDTISYTKDSGGYDDGTSLQKQSDGTWIAALPTPGTANTNVAYVASSTDATTTNQTTQTQTTIAPVQSYVPPPAPSLYADAGDDRAVIVGADAQFDARAYDKNQNVVDTARFSWNFGDGQTAEGESVLHHFSYPGKYDVVLSIAHDRFAALDEITVTAEPAALTFSLLQDGGVEVTNKSGHDLDLSGWVVRQDTNAFASQFILPPLSKVLAGAATFVSAETLHFRAGAATMLEYPNGSLAFVISTTAPDSSAENKTVMEARPPHAASPIPPAPHTVAPAKRVIQTPQDEDPAQPVASTTRMATSTKHVQQAAVAVSILPHDPWWWVGALALSGTTGVGVAFAARLKKREWTIIEDKDE